jgi:hypothetical protein
LLIADYVIKEIIKWLFLFTFVYIKNITMIDNKTLWNV